LIAMIRILSFAALSMMPMLAVAAEPSTPPDSAGALLRVLLSLVVVVAFIFAAGWIARRLQGVSGARGKRLRCLETIAVGVKERIALIEVGGQQLVVGIAPGSIRTLHVLDVPLAEPASISTAEAPRGFAQLLAGLKQGRAS
jgi:flagellar protein FliO/FliZ